MSEQLDGGVGADAPFRGIKLQMSDEARASLMAVRAAQEVARARARRETVRTRAWCGAIVSAIVVGIILLGPRVGRRSRASVSPAAILSAPQPASAFARSTSASVAGTSAPGAIAAAESTDTRTDAQIAATDSRSASATGQKVGARAETTEDCTATFGQRRWRMAAETCARAFEARPGDASLALTVAHSHHARARFAEAGEWARRAIALDPQLAEAFVILAHAETRVGNAPAAAEAYRRYLALAPRGWHASEARAVLRMRRQGEHARGTLHRSVTVASDAEQG